GGPGAIVMHLRSRVLEIYPRGRVRIELHPRGVYPAARDIGEDPPAEWVVTESGDPRGRDPQMRAMRGDVRLRAGRVDREDLRGLQRRGRRRGDERHRFADGEELSGRHGITMIDLCNFRN